MKFFSKETSQKLLRMGCVTNSMMIWVTYPSLEDCLEYQRTAGPYPEYTKPAFAIADFLGDEPHAIENCKNVWTDYAIDKDWVFNRTQLLWAEDQEAFIVKAIKDIP